MAEEKRSASDIGIAANVIKQAVEDHAAMRRGKRVITTEITQPLQSHLLNYVKSGCEQTIRSDLSRVQQITPDRVKGLMKYIRNTTSVVRTFFAASDYASFLEGTLREFEAIHLFGCTPVSDLLMSQSNTGENIKRYRAEDVLLVLNTEHSVNTSHDPRLIPPFVLDSFEVTYKDGVTLKFHYLEVYSRDFLFGSNFYNMFLLLCAGQFCTLNRIGLLLNKDHFVLYRKQNIKERETHFHNIRNFGNCLGLGFWCFKNLSESSSS